MPTVIPDHVDEWGPVLQDAVMAAANEWAPIALDAVFPGSLSASGEGEPMNLEAVLAVAAEWETLVDERVAPVVLAVMAAQTIDVGNVREIDFRPLAEAGTHPTATRDAWNAAIDYLTTWGYKPDDIEIVVTRKTWADFAAAQADESLNLVKGMPETVYAELVRRLSAATTEGLGQFDRNLIVRDMLDMRREGGFEAWNTRADRIARTETARLSNAATMQAGRMESAITGGEIRKSWVATTGDSRTRDTHFEADGQTVPLDGKFKIGGYECDHPGDSSLPPEEGANCRCTVIFLDEGENLPDESDRQTERERADGTRRNPQDEVRRRAERGVTRERDNENGLVADAREDKNMSREWSGLLAPIAKPSGDGRMLEPDAEIDFREFPLPLMFQREQSAGHDTSVIVGKITSGTVEGDGIHAEGVMFDTPEAEEATRLLEEGVIRPSVDLSDVEARFLLIDGDGNEVTPEDMDDLDPDELYREETRITSARVMGATLVAKPAFAEAKIVLGDPTSDNDDEGLVAAAAVATRFEAAAFTDPGLKGPTPLTVDGDRVCGHLALWDTEHVGFPGRSVTPPRSTTGYAMFHVSQVATSDGDLAVGRLTVGTGHAEARAGMHEASSHYDQTGTTWAYVRAGEDQYGIWVAGVVNPDADKAQVRAGASAPLSGDWRRVGGNLELVAALSVNTPGFPVPRTFSDSSRDDYSLVAAAVVPRLSKHDQMVAAVREGLRAERDLEAANRRKEEARDLAEMVGETRGDSARRLAASVMARTVMGGK